ncbi:MAG TPA: hypothetical protein VE776_10785 [Actinomycetota bacterium]|jgi:5-methyltetrahydropteroyltriglutamate--homocysteine methyltransferase|nr:hypothetical protein [Actinomycetota bacterium]
MLFPTSLVGGYPQPDWLIDRAKLGAGRLSGHEGPPGTARQRLTRNPVGATFGDALAPAARPPVR